MLADLLEVLEALGFRPPPEWMRDGLCREYPGMTWFGMGVDRPRAICRRCAVCAECREYALADPTLAGIWGATTERERRQLRAVAVRAA